MKSTPRHLMILVLAALPVAWASAHPHHSHGYSATATAEAGLEPRVDITERDGYRIISSNAIPVHETGRFPNRGNPNTIRPQALEFKLTLAPKLALQGSPSDGFVFGVGVNGVPFEPGTAETWGGHFAWREEAILADGATRLGLDQNNAHVQPTGLYHYHGIPWGLIEALRAEDPEAGTDKPLLVGWAADGFGVYYHKGLESSWRLIDSERPAPPEGPGGKRDGLYTADYVFELGSGDLDYFNGRTGEDGVYRYFVTDDFPFLSRYFAGEPDPSFLKHAMEGHPGRLGHRPPLPR
ncbi:MAG: YHYH protein [Puniceicoccales bacterium]